MDVIVFDMSQFRFVRQTPVSDAGSVLRVEAPHAGTLGVYPLVEGVSDREAVFEALDDLLAHLEMPGRSGQWFKVALYNPLSCQIAFAPVPDTMVFTDQLPLDIPACGVTAVIEGDRMDVQGRLLSQLIPGMQSTQRALAAHRR